MGLRPGRHRCLPTAATSALPSRTAAHGCPQRDDRRVRITLYEAGVVDNSLRPRCGEMRLGLHHALDTPLYYEWVHRNPLFAGFTSATRTTS